MLENSKSKPIHKIARFDGDHFSGKEEFTYLGEGSWGAKAQGLAAVKELLQNKIAPHYAPIIRIEIPLMSVITTDFFNAFMEQNGLFEIASSSLTDEQIALAFQAAKLPGQLVDDLRIFIEHVHVPLAVRSSSLLEDSMHEPFAGVYATKMIPNNQSNSEDRLQKLIGAIKYVYSSTYFKKARDYLKATGHSSGDEEMAVIIQEAVGTCQNQRFYPHVSGVARSFNFYPMGLSLPEDGVVELALGLGKIIVDDGIAWSFSPAYPHTNPPYSTLSALLKQTQNDFWAIDMSESVGRSSLGDQEHLKKYTLADAEYDGALTFIASTFEAEDEKIISGITHPGPRILDFAQILKVGLIPLTALIKDVLRTCEEALRTMVEIEFALTFPYPNATPARFGFLQIRPMIVSHSQVEVGSEELIGDNVLVASESALGNGMISSIRDIVYVKPQTFETRFSQSIGLELEVINRQLVMEKSPYVLIGFGRWGSSDPSAGIPVNFGQISGARVIVEATLPNASFILSQGSHFFHNITSFKVLYFSVGHIGKYKVDWEWLDKQPALAETEFIKHIRLLSPLQIKSDGRTSRGVIFR